MAASVVLVTGGNRGIGYEIVKALVESQLPYHVFLASRDVGKGKEAAASLKPRSGSSISVVQLDVSSPESIANAVAAVKAESGRLDVLVNNAGISDQSPDLLERFRKDLEVNTIAPYAVTLAFKPLLFVQPRDGGVKDKRIVYVSSGLGSIGERLNPQGRFYNSPTPTYRISKAAVNMMAMCDGVELRHQGVKVFAFDPEFVATGIYATPDELRKMGALEPHLSGESCRDIIEGKRDADMQKLVSINGAEWPW
ncbi:hypothetical protein Trco_002641 [Trichoderma cornu-damae]|uniref:Uncharacterized protein n=1 Tax=Trichoderma cornu-damae TaxID=654480 RepID=A0A9P8QPR7_9HYPO|nr:hypothetical protein Trco_002641 [Trichoderma cornu-damae]